LFIIVGLVKSDKKKTFYSYILFMHMLQAFHWWRYY